MPCFLPPLPSLLYLHRQHHASHCFYRACCLAVAATSAVISLASAIAIAASPSTASRELMPCMPYCCLPQRCLHMSLAIIIIVLPLHGRLVPYSPLCSPSCITTTVPHELRRGFDRRDLGFSASAPLYAPSRLQARDSRSRSCPPETRKCNSSVPTGVKVDGPLNTSHAAQAVAASAEGERSSTAEQGELLGP